MKNEANVAHNGVGIQYLAAILVFMIGATTMAAENPPGVHVWKATELESRAAALSQKLDANKVASETLATEGNTTFMVAHREGDGLAEWHETQADVIVITQGEVTMTLGGTIVDGKEISPGEIRGASIQGGVQVKMTAGDAEYIPPKTPHRMTLAPGKKVTYFVTKVTK
jgi:mannose-6-phosphate isomerase-like protein (cupin superfamily)